MGAETLTRSLQETLSVFESTSEPLSTSDVAEHLGLERRTAYARLDRLVEEGHLESKKVGASGRVWWQRDTATDGPSAESMARSQHISFEDVVLDDIGVGIVLYDAAGQVARVNDAIERYFGVDGNDVLGRERTQFIDRCIAPAVREPDRFRKTLLGADGVQGKEERLECYLTNSSGSPDRWLERRSKPIESGAYSGGQIVLYIDITERKHSEWAQGENRREFESLIEAVENYAIFTLDAEGYVQTWNPGAEQIKGYTEEEIVGEHFSVFYTEPDRAGDVPERNLAIAARDGSLQEEGWRVRADGSRFWADVTITSIRDEEGSLSGFAKVVGDVTDRKEAKAERELLYETTEDIAKAETFEDGLRAALEDVCDLTDWEYGEAWIPTDDGDIRRADADWYVDGLAEFARFSEGYTMTSGEGLPGRVYATGEFEWAADLAAGNLAEYPRLDRALEAGLNSALGVPVTAEDDVVGVLTFLMQDTRGMDERLVKLVSSVATELGELIERRRAEQRVEREKQLTDRIIETAPIGMAVFGPDRRLVRANERMTEIYALDAADVSTHTAGSVPLLDADGEPLPTADDPVCRVFETGVSVLNEEVQVPVPGGSTRWVSVNATPVTDNEGRLRYVVATSTDITNLKEHTEQLRRQRDDLEAELDDIFTRIDEAFYALDDELRFEYVNRSAQDLLGHSQSELLGEPVWEYLDGDEYRSMRERMETALETKSATTVECYLDSLDQWVKIRAYPSETGLSVYLTDITERKLHERRLEQYERILETIDDGVYVVDDESRFQVANEAYTELTGYDREELLGAHASLVTDDSYVDLAEEVRDRLDATDDEAATVTSELVTKDGERVPVETRVSLLPVGDGAPGRVGVVRDITERKQRERRLKRFERAIEASGHAIYMTDAEGRITYVNSAFEELTGYPAAEADGRTPAILRSGFHEPEYYRDLWETLRAGDIWDGEVVNRRRDGQLYYAEQTIAPVRDDDGQIDQYVAVQRDITERREREQKLQDRIRQQEIITELGREALETRDLDALMEMATTLVAETLDNDYCKVLDLDVDAEKLHLRHGVGWDDGIVGSASVSAVENDSQAAYTLQTSEPVVVSDLRTESRFSGPDLLRSHDVRSGISTIIGSPEDPWGILGTHDTERTDFSRHDANFVQAVANILATAIHRHRHETEILQQRDQLQALNSLSAVVREITRSVIEQSDREEIEQTVCDRLSDTDSYAFAWIGEVDTATDRVVPRAASGVDGYLSDVTITVDPDERVGQGPTGRAFRTGEVQVTEDLQTDDDHQPWREATAEYGFRSSAAVPISYQGTVYGVLNVYAERPEAFTGQERDVIAQLGEIVGHTIAAGERKEALMSDELVELEFRMSNIPSTLEISADTCGRATLEETVSLGDGEYLVYGRADAEAVDTFRQIVDVVPHWESVTVLSDGDPARVEVHMIDPPVLSVVASLGGYVDQAWFQDDDFGMRLHLAPSVDVRTVIDAIEERYPEAEMVRRRQITREREDPAAMAQQLATTLTDRQRTSLEAAYHAGFFEWPRDTSGEELAESLGVTPPTFHQHLRKAERKLLDTVLSSSAETGEKLPTV